MNNKVLDLYMRSVSYIDVLVAEVSAMPTDAVYIHVYTIFRHDIRDELYIYDNVVYRKRYRAYLTEPICSIVDLI